MKFKIFSLALYLNVTALVLLAQDHKCANKETYKAKCSPCHLVPEPGLYQKTAWEGIMKNMQKLMNESKKITLSNAEYQCILDFVYGEIKSSSQTLDRGKSIYDLKCTLCHQRPEPNMLKLKQWKLVLNLMQERFKHSKMNPLNNDEYNAVYSYIEKTLAKDK
jgi:cytochrome c5